MDQISPANDRPKLTRAEAARRNGALSRGPRTPEGKRRSSMNALKHGLTAATFTLVPGEDGAAFDELEARLAARYRPRDELSAHLVQRLASVMWRQYRADRLEAEVLAEPGCAGASPYAPLGWDAARFAAVQRHQARLDRTLFRLLDALERCQPAPEEEPEPGEPEEMQNEPEQPVDGALEPITEMQNEPTLPPTSPGSATVLPSLLAVRRASNQGNGRCNAGGGAHASPERPAGVASMTLPRADRPTEPFGSSDLPGSVSA